jgi:hypothetical protein
MMFISVVGHVSVVKMAADDGGAVAANTPTGPNDEHVHVTLMTVIAAEESMVVVQASGAHAVPLNEAQTSKSPANTAARC